MGKFDNDSSDGHEFRPILVEIEEKPINPLGRITLWIMLTFFVLLAVWLWFSKIEIVVSSKGKVESFGGTKIVQPMESGLIRSIHIKEGDYVSAGTVLVEIDQSINNTELHEIKDKLLYLELQGERLDSMVAGKDFIPDGNTYSNENITTQVNLFTAKLASYRSEHYSSELELKKLEQEILIANQEKIKIEQSLILQYKRKEQLNKVIDIIAHNEYDSLCAAIVENEESIKVINAKVPSLQKAIDKATEQINLVEKNYKKLAYEEQNQIRIEKNQLVSKLEAITFRREKQIIKSPINGHVNQILINTIGGVVQAAQPLITIVPEELPARIKCIVLNKDIGFVKVGLPVTVKLDSYEYQKYGGLTGVVTGVSRDSIKNEQLGEIYEIYVTPQQNTINIDGTIIPVTPGMTLVADIQVGSRNIIEFFIYPIIKYMNDGLKVR